MKNENENKKENKKKKKEKKKVRGGGGGSKKLKILGVEPRTPTKRFKDAGRPFVTLFLNCCDKALLLKAH